jgi:hypothetical protein
VSIHIRRSIDGPGIVAFLIDSDKRIGLGLNCHDRIKNFNLEPGPCDCPTTVDSNTNEFDCKYFRFSCRSNMKICSHQFPNLFVLTKNSDAFADTSLNATPY